MTPTSLPPRPQQITIADAFREAMRLDGLGQYAEALKICQQILKTRPNQVDVLHLMGVIAFHAGRNEDAIVHLKQALKFKPDMSEAALNLSKVYRHKGKWREYLAALDIVHTHSPERADILTDMGYAEEQLGNHDAAIARFQQALQLDPRAALAHDNLGAILTRQGNIAAAETHLTAALELDPTLFSAAMTLALLHDAVGRRNDVIATYDRILQQHPGQPYTHFQRSLANLCQGNFRDGWEEYAWRFRRPDTRTLHNAFPYPFWQGEPLEGRRLLIWTEQGPGDEILLASMIPDVLKLGAQVTLACSPRLVPLFRRSFKDCTVVSTDETNHIGKGEVPDFQASFSHLGAALRPSISAFPAHSGYLVADAARREKLRTSYQAHKPGTKLIGIAWHSANAGAEDQKSIALANWAPILNLPGITFVSLQYGDRVQDAKPHDIIVDKSITPLKDIDGFAAQVSAMDHVVSVSNTTVHVSGGLGIPTSTMIPASYGRIWYWFLDRSDSPWYPAMQLYRQSKSDGWQPTLNAVATDLARKLGI